MVEYIVSKRLLSTIIVILSLNSCYTKLHLKNIGVRTQLNLNGVYILQDDLVNVNEDYVGVILLYENSLTIKGIVRKDSLGKNLEKTIENFASKKTKTGYGVFEIKDNFIEIEFWTPSSGGPLKTTINKGKVINDETFLLTYMYNNYDGTERTFNNLYKLHSLETKPDSTNRFIK